MAFSLATNTGVLNMPTLILLISVASVIAAFVKRIKIPYTIALVIAGLGLSALGWLTPIELTEELVLFTFLPALLFEASWNLDVRHLKDHVLPVALMATIGVILSITVIGGGMHFLLGLPFLPSLLLGAMVAPTDPVSVVAIMKQFKLDHRLASIIEAESLFNDGTAVVFFKLLTSVLLLGAAFTLDDPFQFGANALLQFILVVGGGALVGVMLGGLFSFITSKFDDHLLELTFTTIVAYGSFFIAEQISVPGQIPHLHLSGVIATVCAGLMMGNVGRQHGMSASTRLVVASFWDYAAFFTNSLIFLIVGVDMVFANLLQQWPLIATGFGIVLVSRIASVYTLSALSKVLKRPVTSKWQHVLVWSSLRGALSMALVLSLPKDLLPGDLRETFIILVFGIVLASLLLQGLTMPKLLRFLNLAHEPSEDLLEYQRHKAILITEQRVLHQLDAMRKSGELSPGTYTELKTEGQDRVDGAQAAIETLHLSKESLRDEEKREVAHYLLTLRKDVTSHLVKEGLLSSDEAEELKAAYNCEIEQMGSSHG